MRSKTIMMIVMAVVFGTMALFAGQKWLDRQSDRLREVQVVAKPAAPAQTIVVAAVPLRFGTELTRQHLREIAWPEGALPKGAFGRIDEVLDGKTRRVALVAVEENEPVLKAKVTGPGQRGSLSALIQEGMRAVTVRVNDVNGVAGFVLPGERVDVMLTRTVERGEAYAEVLLQGVRVLAADQSADERADKPSLVKAVTVEVTTEDAQRLTLAATIGQLSLTLRSAGSDHAEATRRIRIEDLGRPAPVPVLPTATFVALEEPARPAVTAVGVIRGMKRQEYTVPTDVAVEPRTSTASTVGRGR
ncbi:MAG TPA: Flp pilus assembly protein CpaB [Beijerinckiaceae bacterium]|nr:Flp pilus assembly protein CpaB [Beijerinckiaceae bacterium]